MITLLPHLLPHVLGAATPISPANLGTIGTGGSTLSGTSSFTSAIQQVIDTVSTVGGPFALLGMLWGGAVHTHVFHNERAPEQGKQILKMSGFGLFIMVFAPIIISAVEHL